MSDLSELLKRAVENDAKLSPLQRAVSRLQQRESWLIGELMLQHPEMTREQAVAKLREHAHEFVILDEMERLRSVLRDIAEFSPTDDAYLTILNKAKEAVGAD